MAAVLEKFDDLGVVDFLVREMGGEYELTQRKTRNKVRASIGTTPLPTTTTTDNNEVVVPFALRMPPTLLTTMLTAPTTPLPDHLTHDDDDEEMSVNSGLESGWSGDLGGDSMDLSPMGPPGPPLGFSYVKSLLYMLVVLVV